MKNCRLRQFTTRHESTSRVFTQFVKRKNGRVKQLHCGNSVCILIKTHSRCIRLAASSSSPSSSPSPAQALLVEASKEYTNGSKMAALDKFDAIATNEKLKLTQIELLAALYGKMCCLAAAGQVDSAKAALRNAVEAGLDYEVAIAKGEFPQDVNDIFVSDYTDMVKLEASTQMRRLLSSFAVQIAKQQEQALKKELQDEARLAEEASQPSEEDRERTAARLEQLLQSSPSEDSFNLSGEPMMLDTSTGAIVKRVSILVFLAIILFPILYFGGLQLVFPKD